MQEMFDKMLEHLRAQGCRSVDEFDRCRYRGLNGTKCAVGALISDEEYRPSMEGSNATQFSGLFPNDTERAFLLDCQSYMHDAQDNKLSGLEVQAKHMAYKWSLKYAEPV